jgi:serine/threonine-protein kinase
VRLWCISAGLALLVGLGHSTLARADEARTDEARALEARVSGRDLAGAEALYEAGKQLLVSGACEPAIERLEASQALDPAVGTLLLLGHCQEQLGRTASAWASFRAARSLAQSLRQADREQIADTRARALEPRLARLEIWLPSDVDTRGWSVVENERPLPRALLGVALPVDPGVRALRVSAPGRVDWTAAISAEPGSTTRVRVPALTPLVAPSARDEVDRMPPPPVSATAAPAALADRDGSDHGGQRLLAYLGVGLGAAGLGVAAAYGISAEGRYGDAAEHCASGVCTARGYRLRESADERRTIATFSAVGGAVLLASGIGLWLAMPSDTESDSEGASERNSGAPAATALGISPLDGPGGVDGLGMNLAGVF